MTVAEWRTLLVGRVAEAERFGASAPLAATLRTLLAELDAVDGWPAATPPDRLLTLEEAAGRLQVSTRWLREARPPYVVVLGDKTLRVSEHKLTRWLATHDPRAA